MSLLMRAASVFSIVNAARSLMSTMVLGVLGLWTHQWDEGERENETEKGDGWLIRYRYRGGHACLRAYNEKLALASIYV